MWWTCHKCGTEWKGPERSVCPSCENGQLREENRRLTTEVSVWKTQEHNRDAALVAALRREERLEQRARELEQSRGSPDAATIRRPASTAASGSGCASESNEEPTGDKEGIPMTDDQLQFLRDVLDEGSPDGAEPFYLGPRTFDALEAVVREAERSRSHGCCGRCCGGEERRRKDCDEPETSATSQYRILVVDAASNEWRPLFGGPFVTPREAESYAATEAGVPWLVVDANSHVYAYGDARGCLP